MPETRPVQELLRRITELTGDLKEMQARISKQVFQPKKCASFFDVPDGPETLARLQMAIDDLQHAVWLFIETKPDQSQPDLVKRTKLLGRATEILCALDLHPQPRTDVGSDGSFVERLLKRMDGSAPRIELKQSEK